MNKCIFVGRMTRDPEVRYTTSGKQMVKFSIATDTGYGESKKTNFFNMTAWGKTAEAIANYAKKGTKLIIESQANQNQYTDRNGNNVNTVDFNVQNFEFAESKSSSSGNSGNQWQAPQMPGTNTNKDDFISIPDDVNDEGLPFN